MFNRLLCYHVSRLMTPRTDDVIKVVPVCSITLPSAGYRSPLLPQEGRNPTAVRSMDKRNRELVIREACRSSHITSRAVTEAEYCAAEAGTRQA